MSSNIFLSDTEKQSYQNDLMAIHDTWKRPILIFRQAEKVIISQNLNYNPYYGDKQAANDVSSYVINSGIYYARVWHLPAIANNVSELTSSDSDREFTARGEPQIRFRNDKNVIRLKLDISGYQFIYGCKTVQVDSGNYNIKTAYRQHGLFYPEYYTVWLEQSD